MGELRGLWEKTPALDIAPIEARCKQPFAAWWLAYKDKQIQDDILALIDEVLRLRAENAGLRRQSRGTMRALRRVMTEARTLRSMRRLR